jgi:hypothetical protein
MCFATSRTNTRVQRDGEEEIIVLVNGMIFYSYLGLRAALFINCVVAFQLQFNMCGCLCYTSCD